MESIKVYNIASAQGFLSSRNNTNTKLLIHAGEADTTAGTDIIDSSASAHTITAAGDAQVDTDQAKFGTGSVLFDGTGDYLTIPDHADFDLSGGIFTIDFWVRTTIGTIQTIYCQYTDASNRMVVGINALGAVYAQVVTGGSATVTLQSDTGAIVNSKWSHVAVVENGNSWYLSAGGVLVDSGTDTDRALNYTSSVYIGTYYNGATYSSPFAGHLDEIRVVNGEAMFPTGVFTPPLFQYV